MPSWYEGFSMPVLEAMASGTPVIASKRIAVVDYLDDNIVKFNPDDVFELKEKMQLLLTNREYAKTLSNKGINAVKSFSWLSVARDTLKIYESVITHKTR
jgi:alpha-1,3-rhamnosyl/mannosyltransferase